MKKFIWVLLFPLVSFAQQTAIVPQPVSLKTSSGFFPITKKTILIARDAEDKKTASIFNDYLQQVYGFKLEINKPASKNFIRLSTLKFIKAPEHEEGYSLNIAKDGVTINGNSYAGSFYGMQTLIQLLPTDNYKTKTPTTKLNIPLVVVEDYPRFDYRGMHLDVARHFFPISFVKKYIDYLALHKMNYFHWHLTDDQGWRIEIKKYPNLTKVGAWRDGTIIGRYPGTGNDNIHYGGFYTQEQVKEIVKYAANRRITVLPEIEMPGHASAAIAAYPWLSCFPNEETVIPTHPSEGSKLKHGKKVQETWGVFDDVFCAGNDSTFSFLQDVLDEVLPLFPSQKIHVGGDECPKTNWKRCPKCQARMKALGLKDEHELQSYFIQRMEKYLNDKGRTLIGWDEILEGGLAPNAWVMSWRGEEGGITAASQNHNVIMTPGDYCYIDHSQSKNEDSVTIGGYLPVEKVYSYNPVPKQLDSSKSKFIEGAQGNLWTEYIGNPAKVEYMIFPRMSALSEVVWSPIEKKDWSDFEKRLQTQFKRYDLWKANYSRAYFDIKVSILPSENYDGLMITAASNSKEGKLGYVPSLVSSLLLDYKSPLRITAANPHLFIKLFTTNPKTKTVKTLSDYLQDFSFNKATGKKVSITAPPNSKYPGQGGAFSLVNGVYSQKGLSYPDWLGWVGDDLEATIDLGKTTSFDSVRIHTLDQNGSWIYLPQYVEVLTSNDGNTFTLVGKSSTFVGDTLTMGWINVTTLKQSTRFIKVVAKNYGLIPDGKPGAGNKAWLFADEIQVY
ncbi:MAG TPA: family 20 glycosylhydrolase [Flavisolibacter sp.]|jgi:hexosaminidase|nr:family 20 glycosylhydrolase [Flavisolibacter sp.]